MTKEGTTPEKIEEPKLPFSPTVVTQQGELLSDFEYSKHPFRFFTYVSWFYVFSFVASSFYLMANTPYTNAFQDAYFWIFFSAVFVAAFFFFSSMYVNFTKSEKLVKTFYPQRMMTFFDLFPDTQDLTIIQDVFYRLLYVFFRIAPTNEDDKQKIKDDVVKDRIRRDSDYKILKGKKSIEFDLYYEMISSFKTISKEIPGFIFLLIIVITLGTICGYSSYDVDLMMSALFYIIFMLVNLMIILVYLYGVFNTKELVILRHIKEKLTLDQVKLFKDDVASITSGNKKILFTGILTNAEIDNTILEYVQSDDGKISKEYVITLIQKTENGYKLIWTG